MILLAMAIGAGIGALAGTVVYGAKVALSKEKTWNWKDAAAAAGGGLVGGALFPPLMVGLGAVGLPTAAAFVVAGGVAWGGLWTLAEDAARWGLGRATGLGSPWRYVAATAIGMAVTAALLPFASRVIKPGGLMKPHAGTPEAFLSPARPIAPNLLKAEAEFLAYGVASETATTGVRAVANAVARRVATPRASAIAGAGGATAVVTPPGSGAGAELTEPAVELEGASPFASFRSRYPPDPSEPATTGLTTLLERQATGAR